MSLKDFVLIGSTALIGFICGVYVYVTVFVPVYVDEAPAIEEDSELTIIGEAYGGCRRGCASFRLTSDRQFQYLPPRLSVADSAPIEGRYPRAEYLDLVDTLKTVNLSRLSQSINPQTCASMTDGIDYRYTITFEGGRYELDTCDTALHNNKPIQVVLEDVFDVLAQ